VEDTTILKWAEERQSSPGADEGGPPERVLHDLPEVKEYIEWLGASDDDDDDGEDESEDGDDESEESDDDEE
jgi:hypothetical protein